MLNDSRALPLAGDVRYAFRITNKLKPKLSVALLVVEDDKLNILNRELVLFPCRMMLVKSPL